MSCAPFVSSPHDVVKKMLEVARASKDDVLCDLGCGDGRILTTAVKDFGIKAAVGYEIREDRKSTRLNSSHVRISYAVFCLKKKKTDTRTHRLQSCRERRDCTGSCGWQGPRGTSRWQGSG